MANSAPIDRISNLPNELLCKILSCLPTKLAFSATILSKRWTTSLYRLHTHLYFNDEFDHSEDAFLRFRSFVDTVTLSTKLIKTFHLNCCSTHWQEGNRYNNNCDSLIKTVKKHPVENIRITGKFERDFWIFLPPSIFVFPTLVFLKLYSVKVDGNISVNLPSLKTLHLYQFYLKNSENFTKLLNGCPILEHLTVQIFYIEQEVEGVRVSTEEIRTFSKLISADICESNVPLRAICNVEILKLRVWQKLHEPETNSFFRGFLECQNLIYLELSLYRFHHWDNVVEVLHNCPKFQTLSLDKWPYQDLKRKWNDPNYPPECVSSHLKSCTIKHNSMVDELQFATYILQNAPLLEAMKVITTKYSRLRNQDALEVLTICPRISPNLAVPIQPRLGQTLERSKFGS